MPVSWIYRVWSACITIRIRSATLDASIPPIVAVPAGSASTGLLYLNLYVKMSLARVLSLVNPASSTFSVSIPRTIVVDLYSPAIIAILWMTDVRMIYEADSMPLRETLWGTLGKA